MKLNNTLGQSDHMWGGSNAQEILEGVSNLLSISVDNIKILCNQEIVNLLEKTIRSEHSSDNEILISLQCVWKIAFYRPESITQNKAFVQGVKI